MRFLPASSALAVGFSLIFSLQSQAQSATRPRKLGSVEAQLAPAAAPNAVIATPSSGGIDNVSEVGQPKKNIEQVSETAVAPPASMAPNSSASSLRPATEPGEPATATRKNKKTKRKTRRERRSH